MSKDIIYREDAIKAINLRARIPHDIASAHYASMAINAIRSVPSAGSPQEWIPCSKRLPDKSGEYLVTIIQNESSFQQGVTDVFIRFLAPANILYDEGFGEQMAWRQELWEDVVAWMPLPEPWKEADDER